MRDRAMTLGKVNTLDNPAGMLTKNLDWLNIEKHTKELVASL